MLTMKQRLSPNAKAIAAEVIDGEAIIIDLVSGVYYSMDGVGGLIWALIEAGGSLDEIVAAVAARYDVSLGQAKTEVEQVVAELLQENLVVVSEREPQGRADQAPPPEGKLPYETPRLNTYRDMGDLLALDPPVPGLQEIPWKASAETLD